MLTAEQIDEAETVAARLGVERAALLAVMEVESGGRGFAEVNGRREPLIRFEGHYFDRLCPPEMRDRARALGLASPRAGAVANPASQAERWRSWKAPQRSTTRAPMPPHPGALAR